MRLLRRNPVLADIFSRLKQSLQSVEMLIIDEEVNFLNLHVIVTFV